MPANPEAKRLINELKYRLNEPQKAIADRLDVTGPYLSDVINGRAPFSQQLSNKIQILLDQNPPLPAIEKLEADNLTTEGNQVAERTPVYSIEVCGAIGTDFPQEAIIGYVKLPEINPASILINVSGDQMNPIINHQDKILIREILNKDLLVYGHIYLVATAEYKLIRYIRKHPTDPNMLLLTSENKKIEPLELKRTEILRLFLVENVLIIKNLI